VIANHNAVAGHFVLAHLVAVTARTRLDDRQECAKLALELIIALEHDVVRKERNRMRSVNRISL
jgi:hypothetical protein